MEAVRTNGRFSRPLAERVAEAGVTTLVPDWSRDDGGTGRHHLSASLAFTRDHGVSMGFDRIVLAGWSLGANAGLDVVVLTTILGGWRPAGFIGLSGGFDGSPFSERDSFGTSGSHSVPLLLIHGTSDEVVPVERARTTFEALLDAGWGDRAPRGGYGPCGRDRHRLRPHPSPVHPFRRTGPPSCADHGRRVDCGLRDESRRQCHTRRRGSRNSAQLVTDDPDLEWNTRFTSQWTSISTADPDRRPGLGDR